MTGDRESEGSGETAGDGLDPDAVVAPSDGTPAAGSDGDGEADLGVPLPWNTPPDDDVGGNAAASDVEGASGADGDGSPREGPPVPDEFEELRFVGPKTAPILAGSDISIADVCDKRISYRDLTEAGVNPGVAAKIRREHSLSWSLDGGGTDLDRRSSQIRGLDDAERAWIAESSGWSSETDPDAETDESAAQADGSGDATAGEAAWQARTGTGAPNDDPADTGGDRDADGEGVPATGGEAAWRAESGTAEDDDGEFQADGDDGVPDADADGESAWRRRSAPTPLTAVDGFDDEVARTLRKAGIGSVRRLATADPESVADALELDVERVRAWRDHAREHERTER